VGIAQSLSLQGAQLALTYQSERLEENVRSLGSSLNEALILKCDLSVDENVRALMAHLSEVWGGIDFLVHAVAYARSEDLEGGYAKTPQSGFDLAMSVSAYSFTRLVREAAPLFQKNGGGSAVTLSYLGGQRVLPGYNVMGVAKAALESSVRYLANDLGPQNIRVNALSAGPVSTLAARSIPHFGDLLKNVREKAPLRRDLDPAEVGDAALFLCSSLSRAVTGQVLFVDCGYSILAC